MPLFRLPASSGGRTKARRRVRSIWNVRYGRQRCSIYDLIWTVFPTDPRTGELRYCSRPYGRSGKRKGDIGGGHVRYSTAGASIAENTQPLVLNYIKGTLSLAHNGNLVNALELRRELELSGAIFQTSIDSEVIAYLIARERLKVGKVEEAVKEAMKKIKGAYSLVVASPRKLIGARDPFGFRPLCIGKRDGAYMLSSEACAFYTAGA